MENMDNNKKPDHGNKPDEGSCSYKMGPLPCCAPLATSYVPTQQGIDPMYARNDALTRGTLFPGLDLALMNKVNESNPYAGTPLGELMALQFMVKELQLYLDTHPDDEETFCLLRETLSLEQEARKRYAERFGPIQFSDLIHMDSYDWLKSPWPWEYSERTGDK